MEPEIIYENKDLAAVNKPAGFLTHSTPTTDEKSKTLTDWLLKKYPEIKNVGDPSTSSGQAPSANSGQANLRPGIVHRLDKDTSGVILVAKNQKTFEFLKKQFQERKIKKTYLALVKGDVKKTNGKIDTPIQRFIKSREAETEYKVIKKFKNYTLLEAYPKTGRTHQIRIHLKSIGHPVVCEKLYAKKPQCPLGLTRHFLHAKSLEFLSPEDTKIKIEAELPADLKSALKAAEKYDT